MDLLKIFGDRKEKGSIYFPHQNPVLVLVKDFAGVSHVRSNNDFDLLKFSETQRRVHLFLLIVFSTLPDYHMDAPLFPNLYLFSH